MADRINDIAWQAHQGSVAAIIQVLNEKLVESGVRTRAIFADGVLQLLCEAATVEQLEQSTLVQKIRQILESITPRNIRRVNINSRIVREQQLLWLTEIYRDRENQLLWSEEITLPKTNTLKQLIQDFQDFQESKTELGHTSLPKPKSSQYVIFTRKNRINSKNKHKYSFQARIIKASGLCLPLLLLSWGVYTWLDGKQETSTSRELSTSLAIKSQASRSTASKDPFADAVRIANQASASGKTASTLDQWSVLAARWQQASDLMSQVPPNHSRYLEAQTRIQLYKKFSEAAQIQAKKSP
ncbi:MAG: hypothetical protein KME32_00010 [Mojavia pulchra JT2-VF2]|jgi:hypothetical protein|uniref:Uncharacterized protein n=1 Tax=Mojavia pulchra JT2-VF2 TaxID=287848 RepID=A0A951PTG5_9NOST|nr:hypothetical protein [Mojavia pulchra JT2-VF2]